MAAKPHLIWSQSARLALWPAGVGTGDWSGSPRHRREPGQVTRQILGPTPTGHAQLSMELYQNATRSAWRLFKLGDFQGECWSRNNFRHSHRMAHKFFDDGFAPHGLPTPTAPPAPTKRPAPSEARLAWERHGRHGEQRMGCIPFALCQHLESLAQVIRCSCLVTLLTLLSGTRQEPTWSRQLDIEVSSPSI